MKTNVEIPDTLFVVITERARQAGQSFDMALTDALLRGIEPMPTAEPLAEPIFTTDARTGLHVIGGGHPPRPGQELTADQIAELLNNQEVAWLHATSRR